MMKPEHQKQIEEDSFLVLVSAMGTLVIVGLFIWLVEQAGFFEWLAG
jgi:hypothetical protein